MVDPAKLFVGMQHSLRDVMACVDRVGKGIALVVNEQHQLLATLTDGDLRRAILSGADLSTTVSSLLDMRGAVAPVTAPTTTTEAELVELMRQRTIRQVPLLDTLGAVVGLAVLDELVSDHLLPLTAVVMAGGQGVRLRPLTNNMPKPMLPLGGKPLLDRVIGHLRSNGITHVHLTTHYRGDIIEKHLGDGSQLGVTLNYVQEDDPLGTAGALGLLPAVQNPLLVMNGDILTQVDVRAMFDFHRQQEADITVGAREHEMQVPYGVVETNGAAVTAINEKPLIRNLINAGIYVVSPSALAFIPRGQRMDMPDLIRLLMARNMTVACFPIREYWKDIGHIMDYEQAQADVENGKV